MFLIFERFQGLMFYMHMTSGKSSSGKLWFWNFSPELREFVVLSLRLRGVKQKQYSLCLTAKSIKWNLNERYISNFADTRNAYHIQFVSQFLSYLLGVLLTLASAYIYYHVRFVSDMYHILIVSE